MFTSSHLHFELGLPPCSVLTASPNRGNEPDWLAPSGKRETGSGGTTTNEALAAVHAQQQNIRARRGETGRKTIGAAACPSPPLGLEIRLASAVFATLGSLPGLCLQAPPLPDQALLQNSADLPNTDDAMRYIVASPTGLSHLVRPYYAARIVQWEVFQCLARRTRPPLV